MSSYTILLVDDERDILDLLKDTFEEAGYRVLKAMNPKDALEIIEKDVPDIILSDNRMPKMSGIEFFERMRQTHPEPIRILMTGFADLKIAIEAINRGWVYKFITKPFKMEEILLTIQRTLEYYEMVKQKQLLEQQIREQNAILERRVKERTEKLQKLTAELEKKNKKLLNQKSEIRRLFTQLQRTYLSTILALYFAIEAKDKYTRGHSERVYLYALRTGRKLGLSRAELVHLKYASLLHDLGKIGIPDSILLKPGKLTEEEYSAIKEHPVVAALILDPISFLSRTKEIIRHHHERCDGNGYPDGLGEDMINVQSRIIAVADAYDAMRSSRPYRDARTREEAMEELKRYAGRQFCPACVEAFEEVIQEMDDFYSDPEALELYQNELQFMEEEIGSLHSFFAIHSPEMALN